MAWIVVHLAETNDIPNEPRLVNTDDVSVVKYEHEGAWIVFRCDDQLHVTESLAELTLLLGAVELVECTTCEGTGRFSVARYKRRLDAEKYPRLISSPLPDDGSPCGRCSGTGKVIMPYRERGE